MVEKDCVKQLNNVLFILSFFLMLYCCTVCRRQNQKSHKLHEEMLNFSLPFHIFYAELKFLFHILNAVARNEMKKT